MLSLIVNTADPQQNGLLHSFESGGQGIEQDFVRGDVLLALSHRPVVSSITNFRPWDDDLQTGDTFEIAIGNPDTPATSGTFKLGVQRSATHAITTVDATNPANVACTGHGVATGDVVFMTGVVGSTPDVNNQFYTATRTDANNFTIPVNVTAPGAGGTLTSFNTAGLTALAYNISAGALATAISTPSTTEGYGTVTGSLFEPGNYELTWTTPGAVPTLYASGALLNPASTAFIAAINAGSGASQAIQLLQLEQQPVAFCEPATLYPAADIAATITRHGAAGPPAVDKLYALTMTDGTYGGTFSVTLTNIAAQVTSFIVPGTITAQDFQTTLSGATGLTAADILVTRVGDTLNVQFTGAQGGSDTPTLSVTNIDLLAPMGVTGVMNLNTVNLYLAFAQTTAATLAFTFAIRRTRLTGEQAEYFQHAVTLKRNLINVSTISPVPLPSYYTSSQVDALLLQIKDVNGSILVGDFGKLAALGNGFVIQVSTDGVTWQDYASITAI